MPPMAILVIMISSSAAQAAIQLPGGDLFANGTFEFTWGSSGSTRIDPALYVGGNAAFPSGFDQTFVPPDNVTAATGLGYGYSISDLGTDTARITYRITNNTDTSWHNLRFIGDVSGDTFDTQMEIVNAAGATGTPGEASRFGVDDFFTGDLFLNDVVTLGQLDNANHCASACQAEGALQWDLDVLGQGKVWEIGVSLSQAGVKQSERLLEFTLTDFNGDALNPAQVLTYSGTATVVPVPGSLLLFSAGLAGLAALRPVRRSGSTNK